jgi:PKD domain/FecR protein
MRKVLSACLGFCLLSLGQVYAEDASTVRATRVDGTVLRNGMPLKEGDIIQRDDTIEAKATSAAVLTWSNGTMIEVYPDTWLVLKGVSFEADRKLEKTLFSLVRGRVFVKAQVPENMFCHFEMKAGGVTAMAQGAEFAMKYDEAKRQTTIWSLLGTVIADMDPQRIRIDEGQQATIKAGTKLDPSMAMSDRTKEALLRTSQKLGGSLLVEEQSSSIGGPLIVRIGGVLNRRGNAPYTVAFKALPTGGSGKIKSTTWRFGDGESATGKTSKHTFTQGVYVVVLQIEDENGEKATAQLNISVEENCGC